MIRHDKMNEATDVADTGGASTGAASAGAVADAGGSAAEAAGEAEMVTIESSMVLDGVAYALRVRMLPDHVETTMSRVANLLQNTVNKARRGA